jgi:chitodextrinase
MTLSGDPAFVRTDNEVNFIWAGNQPPDPSLTPNDFSVRWSGNFTFSQGNYTFSLVTSDGMRLYLDGNLILDRWNDQPPSYYTVNQTISQGSHLVTVEYYAKTGSATAEVSWKNNSQANGPAPIISSFTAPATTSPGFPVTLAWTVMGATTVTIDNNIGDVTSRSSISVLPNAFFANQITMYTLTASNAAGSNTASVFVTESSASISQNQSPTTPRLTSATAISSGEVDLAWTASSDNLGIAGYQVTRNGSPVASVSSSALSWADTTVSPSATYVYSVKAFDSVGSYSAPSNAVQVTTPGATTAPGCPAPGTNAFTGCYYSNQTLSGNPAFVRTESQINFNWGSQSPDPSLQPGNFSVQWSGNFTFSQSNYTFSMVTSDGMRVYVDGGLILDAWHDQAPTFYTVSQTMSQGSHLIVVQYYDKTAAATAEVSWQSNSPVTGQAPIISSFTAAPATIPPGFPVTIAWTVMGATTIAIDNGIGNVTNRSSISVLPNSFLANQTTTYTLTASNTSGSSTATVTVTVSSSGGGGGDTQPPTTPTLTSATAARANEVDLTWTASSDNVGVAGYQIVRNGSALASVPGSMLNYADTSCSPATTYTYSVNAYDAAGNHSSASNPLQVTTPSASTSTSGVSVTWYGACWYSGTVRGVTGNYQAVDFLLKTPTPVPLEGTLFYGPTCSNTYGTDNLNDTGQLFPSVHWIEFFTNNVDVQPVSALYWIGDRTPDGQCPAGAPCSGCLRYNQNTPNCNNLP